MGGKKKETSGILSEDVLSKLEETKKDLLRQEQERIAKEEEQRKLEKKQKEKNMSFSEMLERYGDKGNKF